MSVENVKGGVSESLFTDARFLYIWNTSTLAYRVLHWVPSPSFGAIMWLVARARQQTVWVVLLARCYLHVCAGTDQFSPCATKKWPVSTSCPRHRRFPDKLHAVTCHPHCWSQTVFRLCVFLSLCDELRVTDNYRINENMMMMIMMMIL